jgi:tetratricopeptide (TPR) repeat protein/predicted aspartyl protease
MRIGNALSLAMAAALSAPAAEAASKCHMDRVAEMPVRMVNLKPTVTAKINGQDVTFVADTGAFFSLLATGSAKRLGLKLDASTLGLTQIEGITGSTGVWVTKAKDFSILGVTLHDADFLVAGESHGGVDGLLGQNLLGFVDTEFDFGAGAIRLFKAYDCDKADLGYWAQGADAAVDISPISPGSNKIRADVTVNGVRMHAILDTGTGYSVLSLSAAKRIGFRADDPAVKPGGAAGGISGRLVETWIAPFKSFAIGGEQVQNTKLRVADIDLPESDMILGSDFFLSHRIFVAKSQSRLYFTYNGGPVFDLGRDPTSAQTSQTSAPADDLPTDAAGFMRRAEAYVSRREFSEAIADFSRAAALAPSDPKPIVERAMAHWTGGDLASARTDLDAALKLKPGDATTLVARGKLRLEMKDDTGARADFDAAEQADRAKQEDVAYDYQQALRFPDAVAEYGKLVAAGTDHDQQALALNNRCWTRALWGQELDQALDDCNEALKLKPNFAPYLDSRGLVELRLGRLDASTADYTAALRKMPQSPWTLYGRGLAEQRQGLKAKGDADIAAATALSPELPKRLQSLGILPK